MDNYGNAKALGGSQIAGIAAPQPQKMTAADDVRDNAERAVARLSSLRGTVLQLRGRVNGEYPSASEQAGETINASGFVPGVGSAVNRIHDEITAIEDVLASLNDVI